MILLIIITYMFGYALSGLYFYYLVAIVAKFPWDQQAISASLRYSLLSWAFFTFLICLHIISYIMLTSIEENDSNPGK